MISNRKVGAFVLAALACCASGAQAIAQAGLGPVVETQAVRRPGMNPMKRAQVERRLEDRINEVIRQRLALNDEQYAKLREVSARHEADKRSLRSDEVSTRFALRQELLAGDRINENHVGELLDKLPALERRRGDLMEQEQRDLAKFLSPSQRARYFALQDELRRTMQEMQRRRMGLDGGSDSLRPPPPPRGRRGPPPGSPTGSVP